MNEIHYQADLLKEQPLSDDAAQKALQSIPLPTLPETLEKMGVTAWCTLLCSKAVRLYKTQEAVVHHAPLAARH